MVYNLSIIELDRVYTFILIANIHGTRANYF